MKKAAIYSRVSRDVDGVAAAVQRQEADCQKLCSERGFRVLDTYRDNDLSAWSGKKPRKAYEQMLCDVRAGAVDVIVCWHPDRLHRSPKELEEFIDVVEANGVDVVTVTSGDRDLGTPDGRFRARIEGAVARKESDDKSRRLRRKHEELAEQGRVPGGGNRPFGFERDRKTVREDEAEVIREIARRVLAGESLYRIQNDLDARGVKTSTGGKWSTTGLKTLLVNPRLIGERRHPRVGPTKAEWPAILERSDWERVVALLEDPSRRRNPVVRKYLLTRLIVCGRCGRDLKATPRSAGKDGGPSKRAYGCPPRTGCGRVFALADPIEEIVIEQALQLADLAETRTMVADEAARRTEMVSELLAEVAEAERSLDDLTRACFVDRTVPERQFATLSRELQAKAESARSRVATMQGGSVLDQHAGHVRDVWDELDLEQRRAVVQGVIGRIELRPWEPGRPRNVFDPERLTVTPRWATLMDIAERHKPKGRKERAAAREEYRAMNRQG